ncbi:MAG: YcbK family protein [Sulfuricurvum sp.]|nr:YcbK family protein [Sulfuricurvum sp.]
MDQKNLMDRRSFLKIATVVSAVSFFPSIILGKTDVPYKKSLSLYNIHTGENINATYWADGSYIPEALSQMNHLLRDYRTDAATDMDTELFDLLYSIRTNLGTTKPFNVISGYRSPKTNAMLNSHSSGVAKKSLHMQGKAMDISLPGRDLSELKKIAMNLKQGGVGYYPSSDFVHVDVGRVRYW